MCQMQILFRPSLLAQAGTLHFLARPAPRLTGQARWSSLNEELWFPIRFFFRFTVWFPVRLLTRSVLRSVPLVQCNRVSSEKGAR